MKIFWSWQSDTPGKSGRHFIKDALQAAIQDLKAELDLDEPIRVAIHLDSDRQGVPGSPDLAATIFDKIDVAAVVVADVTPVGQALEKTEGQDHPKALMNPNVAIELGYTLGKRGSNRLVMVCNAFYGSRADLPFDLAHKAGPLFFCLAPDASSEIQREEKAKLTGQLKSALRVYLVIPEPESRLPFEDQPEGASPGVFFAIRDLISETPARFGSLGAQYRMVAHPVFYMRASPHYRLSERLTRSALFAAAQRLPFFSGTGGNVAHENKWGAVCLEPADNEGNLESLVQIFLTGEIWAINSRLLGRFEAEKTVPFAALEYLVMTRLPSYVTALGQLADSCFPIKIRIGVVAVSQWVVAGDNGERLGIAHNSPSSAEALLVDKTPNAYRTLFLTLFKRLFRNLTDEDRPQILRGFP